MVVSALLLPTIVVATAASGDNWAGLSPVPPPMNQCEDQNGCSPPRWDVRWDMGGSGYIYCFGRCPLDWLANNTHLGVFGGVVGVDHYWTKQGMPCVNGKPREFAMQDEFAVKTKRTFPRAKVLQYRITDAVPYDPIVHEKMVSDPDFFVRWHHPPHNNGSICLMPYEEHLTGRPEDHCSWEIKAAAYDWSQQKVRDWYVQAIIAPTLKVADGAWIDGDGPDNGAWMCSSTFISPPKPYPALDMAEIATFAACEKAARAAAQKYLITRGGFDYNCFDFVASAHDLPQEGDGPAACAAKLKSLDHKVFEKHSAVVLYGNRISAKGYTDANVTQAVAAFMLTRGEHWFFGYPNPHGDLVSTTAAVLLTDYGTPLGNMTEGKAGVFERRYQKVTVSLDCNTFTARFDQRAPRNVLL